MSKQFGLDIALRMIDDDDIYDDIESIGNGEITETPEVYKEIEVESRTVASIISESLSLINTRESSEEFEDGNNSDKSYILTSSSSESSESDEPENQTFLSIIEKDQTPVEDLTISRSRKRKRDPENWKRTVCHRRRISGKSYVNRSGKTVPEKTPKQVNCSNCRFKCNDNFSENKRHEICSNFYSLADVNRQKDFICRRVKIYEVKRHRSRCGNDQKKNKSYAYYLTNLNKEHRVCKKFFLTTLGISQSYVIGAISNINLLGNYSGDERIGKPAQNKIDADRIQQIRDHINSFPTIELHYCRQHTKAKYLDSNLSISKMYSLCLTDYCASKGIEPVKQHKYREVFVTEFNLRFFKPMKDQCSVCNAFYSAQGEDKESLRENWISHKEREESMTEKNTDKEKAKLDERFMSVSFDLEAVLNLPHAGDAQIYYKRKLSVYNFTILEHHSLNGYCYVWTEDEGQRGSSEIGSCLLTYIKNMPDTVTHLSTFSDTCSGQNRNQFVAAAMLHAVQASKPLDIIDMKFMETGHSYMEVDSMHSAIERAAKHQRIFTTKE
ncbi:hypothetical protein SNE40_017481 [Patella caerulea]|uniref:DUF7869 domain-containing protein n=1 Tax=Patella caerulea TaxID=87958 RepID=A0AAN8JAH5_PATCE